MGGSGNTTTVTKSDPWKPSQPYLMGGLTDAAARYGAGQFRVDPYTGPTVANPSNPTIRGQSLAMYYANQGTPGVDAANSAVTRMMGGDPYRDLDVLKRNALSEAIPAASAVFSNSGMLNSSQAHDTIARAATEAIAPIEYGAWSDQQGRALQAATLAPSLDAARYMPAQVFQQIGAQTDALNQAKLDAAAQYYYASQNAPYDELARYQSLLLGMAGQGGQASSTGPSNQPGVAGRLGGGLMTGLGAYGGLVGASVGAPVALPLAAAAGLLGAIG